MSQRTGSSSIDGSTATPSAAVTPADLRPRLTGRVPAAPAARTPIDQQPSSSVRWCWRVRLAVGQPPGSGRRARRWRRSVQDGAQRPRRVGDHSACGPRTGRAGGRLPVQDHLQASRCGTAKSSTGACCRTRPGLRARHGSWPDGVAVLLAGDSPNGKLSPPIYGRPPRVPRDTRDRRPAGRRHRRHHELRPGVPQGAGRVQGGAQPLVRVVQRSALDSRRVSSRDRADQLRPPDRWPTMVAAEPTR